MCVRNDDSLKSTTSHRLFFYLMRFWCFHLSRCHLNCSPPFPQASKFVILCSLRFNAFACLAGCSIHNMGLFTCQPTLQNSACHFFPVVARTTTMKNLRQTTSTAAFRGCLRSPPSEPSSSTRRLALRCLPCCLLRVPPFRCVLLPINSPTRSLSTLKSVARCHHRASDSCIQVL